MYYIMFMGYKKLYTQLLYYLLINTSYYIHSLVDSLFSVGSLPLESVAEASGLLCRDLLLSPAHNTYIINHVTYAHR